MRRQRRPFGSLAAVIAAAALAAGGCGSSSWPTTGPATQAAPTEAPTAEPTPTAASTPTPVTPAPTDAPTATPAAATTAPPTLAPTDTVTPAPTTPPAPAAGCTGSSAFRQWLAEQATHFTWKVYCAALPSGWAVDPVNGAKAYYDHGGRLEIYYAAPTGRVMWIQEGNFCSSDCVHWDIDLGPATFAGMSGHLYRWESLLVLYVDPGTTHAYTLYSEDVTETAFRSYAAAFKLVPKP